MAIYGSLGDLEVNADYPSIQPTLDLNFAKTKALDSRITFYRNSLATYTDDKGIIRTVPENVPRFDHDPTTGESLGLLIEESRTNTQTNSQPQSGSFTGGDAVVTYNTSTAPNGETEACRIARNGTDTNNSSWRATRSITFNANTMVLSCWAKPQNGNNYFVWSFQNLGGAIVRAGFLLTGDGGTQIITNGNGGHTLQIEKYPDGWYRCIIIGNTQSSGTTTQFLYTAAGYDEDSSVIGGSTLVWGFQLEVGSFPTSYIPTSGSTVTRTGDVCYMDGTNFSNWYNPIESTIYSQFICNNNASLNNRLFRINSNDFNRIDYVIANQYHPYIETNAVAQVVLDAGSLSSGVVNKVAVGLINSGSASVINGGTVTTSGTITLPIVNKIEIGNSNYTLFLNGTLSRFIYYPKRLTNTQLQNLTA